MKLLSSTLVPHEGPEYADIMFIGEAPGSTEDDYKKPFVGPSGTLLERALSSIGLEREDVRIGNVLNYQPAGNKFELSEGSRQLVESKKYLKEWLEGKRPDGTPRHRILVPLGREALAFLTGFYNIEKRRGSVYEYNGMYVLPTVHPAYILRDGSQAAGFMRDMQKIKRILSIMEQGEQYEEYSFHYKIDPNFYELQEYIPLIQSASRLSIDIETKIGTHYIRCVGVAWDNKHALCVFNDAPYNPSASNQYPIGPFLASFIKTLQESPATKIFHNGMFDTLMFFMNNYSFDDWDECGEDTMIRQHVLQPDLPLGLDYCTSIYTDINYYKDDGKESSDRIDRNKLGLYNCKDVIAAMLIYEEQEKEFFDEPEKKEYYRYKMSQIPVAKHFSLTGMYVSQERHAILKEKVDKALAEDMIVFVGAQQIFGVEPFSVGQHKKVQDFLYKTLELPPKRNKDGGLTAGEDAIVELISPILRKTQELKTEKSRSPWEIKLGILKLLLRIRGLEKLRSSYIDIKISPDGRVRSWYKFFGTETGRWSAASWYDNTGLNGQTIPRESI